MWTNWFEVYMTPVFKITFPFNKINPLETAGLGKILHTFAVSIGALQMLPLILENPPFPCIITIFLNKILLKIKNVSIF